jgi:hypothetical protein
MPRLTLKDVMEKLDIVEHAIHDHLDHVEKGIHEDYLRILDKFDTRGRETPAEVIVHPPLVVPEPELAPDPEVTPAPKKETHWTDGMTLDGALRLFSQRLAEGGQQELVNEMGIEINDKWASEWRASPRKSSTRALWAVLKDLHQISQNEPRP